MTDRGNSIAKITRPVLSDIVQRKRLYRLMDEARKRSLVWITAPGGSGKTTLVASYLDQRRLPCLWYQVDERDADPATFFYYMGLAAKRAVPRKRTVLPLLTPEYLAGLDTFTRRFFEKLYIVLAPNSPHRQGGKGRFVLVLDNYQDVSAKSPLHGIMNIGLSVIPEGMNVVVISRKDLYPEFARIRANKRVSFIGWDELRFTEGETKGMLLRHRCRRITQENIRQLHDKTDGWAAGLVLFIEKAKTEGIDIEAVEKITREGIFDYFAMEVFKKVDKGIQGFLLKTAFLPQVAPEMAEKLTGIRHAGDLLGQMNQEHFFTTRHSGQAIVFQYHPLFREFLLATAERVWSRKELREVQRDAALLLEGAGRIEDAVELFFRAEAWPEVSRLICKQAESLLAQGRSEVVRAWLGRLPQEHVNKNPQLLYWRGVCIMPFSPAESRVNFEKAFGLFGAVNDQIGMLLAWSGAADTSLHESEFKHLDHWLALFEALFKNGAVFPSAELEARFTMSVFNAMSLRQPHHPEIGTWRDKAVSLVFTNQALDINVRLQAGVYLAVHFLWIGDFAKATMMVNFLQEMIRSENVSDLVLLFVKTTEALYYVHTGESDKNRQAVAQGLAIAEEKGVHVWDDHLIGHGLASALSEADLALVDSLLKKMKGDPKKARRFDVAYYHIVMAWKAMHIKDYAAAYESAKIMLDLMKEVGFIAATAAATIGMVEIQRERREYTEASAYLSEVFEVAGKMKSRILEFMGHIAAALLNFDQRNEDAGLSDLRKAMILGRENGYTNMFWWRPPVMAKLCARALEAGIEAEYVRRLIIKRNLVLDPTPVHIETWPWKLRIYTMGRFAIEKNSEAMSVGGGAQKKPLDMLKVLIALGADSVMEEEIADILWPDAEGDAAHSAFTTTMSRLRKLIGEETVTVKGGRVSIDRRFCWVDVWALEDLIGRLNEGLNNPGDAERFGGKVIALYRGAFLLKDGDGHCIVKFREKLRSRFLNCLSECGRSLIGHGRYDDAIAIYRKGLEVDDLSEEFYRGLMTSYLHLGRRSEGLAVYNRCREILKRAFDVEPSRETEALCSALRRGIS